MRKQSKAFNILNSINAGWNLGNYLDATDRKYIIGDSSQKSLSEVVELWHNPNFNLKCVDTLISYGFNCVRIPVTWCNFINIQNKKMKISNELITYLKQIVDYSISKKCYVILDMHHDDQNWLKIACSKKEFNQIKKFFAKIWEIVAFEFKDYNSYLIFEGMNEVVDRTNAEHHDWIGKKKIFYSRLNKLYSIFVKSVRKFSLFNKNRTLMISTYGAQIHETALSNLKMPKDNNIILDLHFYSRHNDMQYYENKFKYVFENLIANDVPLVLGEIGSTKDAVNDFSVLKTYLDFVKKYNLKYILWDSGSTRKYIDRRTAEFTHLELKEYLK